MDRSVSSHTIKGYFQILDDTLLGRWVPAYTKRQKRRVVGAGKFYFSDVGVVNHLAGRADLGQRTEVYGKAFENWVCHELAAHSAYSDRWFRISHWRLAGGTEVDFIIDDMQVAIEAKASAKITSDHLRGLRSVVTDHPRIARRIVVCTEPRARLTDDGILILPAMEFSKRLTSGELF